MPRPFRKFAFPSLLAALFCLGAGTGLADEPKEKKPPNEKDESWVYRSKEHNFSLRLPSKRWKEIGKGKSVVAFHNLFPFPMTAGVLSAKDESLEQYRETVKKFREYVKKVEATLLEKSEIIEQETEDGNLRCCFLMKEKGNNGDEYIEVGMSYTWLKKRGVTVQILFEGVGQAKSRLFKSKEKSAFEEAAKVICLSVE